MRARRIAQEEGLKHVYTGNVHDTEGGTTFCPDCHAALIVRDWHRILRYDEVSGHTSVFRAPSQFANGLCRDRQGRLLCLQ